MKSHSFVAVLLCAAFGLFECLGQDVNLGVGTAKFGERCVRDRNCIPHAFCWGQTTCVCETYYSPTLDKAMCIPTEGAPCADNNSCGSMTNARCRQGKCACQDTYVLDNRNSSNCISRPTKEGDRCQREDDCQDALGRAMCIDELCRCLSNYHFVNQTGKCEQTRYMYNSCKNDYDCKSHDDRLLECRRGECLCKLGEPDCSKASLHAIVGGPVILLAILLRLV
ncbi:uncharacterized protein LOC116432694 [Nomia melanderi]|uniref:uncharacterized protein LOC116432694 n=1 Tax=Nomia melanderi TaxID=2448451 RepID=UPI001303F6D0|nr:cell death abnormality protein 1-like [Nomia melanderi]